MVFRYNRTMSRFLAWLKNNKITALLLLVIIYLLWKNSGVRPLMTQFKSSQYSDVMESRGAVTNPMPALGGIGAPILDQYSYVEPESPPTSSSNRMVVRDTSVSLQVKSVGDSVDRIEDVATQAGGYMVDSYLNRPEGAASGSITIRIPIEKRKEVLATLHGLAVKVVSESVMGRDVTDEYVDLESRLAVLSKTKAKFEEILDRATSVQDLLNVQRELVNLQSQIDSLKGQQAYLSQTAKLSKITVYLATDEFALPYTPDQPWRPEVIFKQAVRSLIVNIRSLGTLLIWLGVYAVIWVPVALVIWWWMRRSK